MESIMSDSSSNSIYSDKLKNNTLSEFIQDLTNSDDELSEDESEYTEESVSGATCSFQLSESEDFTAGESFESEYSTKESEYEAE